MPEVHTKLAEYMLPKEYLLPMIILGFIRVIVDMLTEDIKLQVRDPTELDVLGGNEIGRLNHKSTVSST